MKRNLKTKLLSALLVVVMVITSITVWPAQEEVKAASNYVELTFSDFGFDDGVYTTGNMKSNTSITSLDGVAITGDIVLPKTGDHTGLQLEACEDGENGWTTFQVFRVNNEVVIRHWGATYKDTLNSGSYSSLSLNDLGVTDYETTKIRMRLCFDAVDETTIQATTTMSVGTKSITRTGVMTGGDVEYLLSNSKGYQIGPAEDGASSVGLYSVEREYKEWTFSDFGFIDGVYNQGSMKSNASLTSLAGLAITGDIVLPKTGDHTGLQLEACEDGENGWTTFQVFRVNNEIVIRHWGATYKDTLTQKEYSSLSLDELGVTDYETTKIRMRLCFDAVGGTTIRATTTMSVGTKSITRTGVMTGGDVAYLLSNSKGYRLGPGEDGASSVGLYSVKPEPRTITFSDLGINDGNYAGTTEYGELPSDIASWDNVTVVGYVTMPASDGGQIRFAAEGAGKGLKLFASDSEQIWVWDDASGANTGFNMKDAGGNIIQNLVGQRTKFSITFKYTGNDVGVTVVINDTYTIAHTFKNNIVDSLGRDVVVNGNVTVESYEEPTEDGPITLTFSDLGIPDGNYAGTSKEGKLPSGISSWDNVTVEGYVMMPSNDGNAFLGIAGSESKSEGLKLFASSSEQIWFWNTLNNNANEDSVGLKTGDTDKTDSANVLGNVTGEYMKMSITFKYVENDLNMIVVINDTWTLDWTFTDIVDLIGRKVIVSGNVTVGSIMEYTELTFNDLGFADGNYSGQNVTGQLPSNVNSWHRVAISGHLGFYEASSGTAFRIGGTGESDSVAMFYLNDQLWLWDSLSTLVDGGVANHGGFKAESTNTEGATLGTVYETPLKVRFEFAEFGKDLYMRVIINDEWEDAHTYTNVLDVIQKKFCMTGNITVGIPEEPLAVSFNSFGMEDNKILGMTTSSTMVPENATTLDGMLFTGYVTFYENTSYGSNGKVTFGVNDSGSGIDMWLDGSNVWFWDSTGGVQASGADNGGIGTFSVSDLGLTGDNLIGQELKVEVAFTYTDSGVEFYYSVNDHENTRTISGFQNYIGTGIKVTAGNNAVAYRSSLAEEYSVANRLSGEGYKRVTVTDFPSLGYQSYNRTSVVGVYDGAENMNGTYLDMDVCFTDIIFVEGDGGKALIRYAAGDNGNKEWDGITIRSNAAQDHFWIYSKAIPYASIGMSSMKDVLNVKIALKKMTVDGTDSYLMSIWVNEIQIYADETVLTGNIGNKLLVYSDDTVNGTANTSTITFEPTEYTEVTNNPVSYSLRGYDHTTAQNYLVTGDATVTKNGAAYTVTNNQISEPGDYTIVTEVASTASRYTQVVSLYILGDVDLNGTAGEQADLDALQGMVTKNPYDTTTAAEYAADLDNDGTVDDKDLELLTSVVGDADALTAVLTQYHVPALTYDYIGGDDVMPIGGYFGPYRDATRSYLTDEIYQKIKESGINIINHTPNDAGYELSYVREALELADEYGLGWFVSDYKLNPKINVLNNNAVDSNAEMLTTAQLASRLGLYSYYDSFLGSHIKDEPSYNGGDENQDYNMMDYYTDASAKLNGFANTLGIINLPAEDARTINNYNSWITSWRQNDNYDEYWAQYVEDSKPKVYSADDYQFFGTAGTNDADSYFRTLGKIRQESIDNSTPFWFYVQVGGDFDTDSATMNSGSIASEAETYWSVNTALAFGAKGIEWFPTIQPQFFDGISNPDAEQSVDRNGLILSDGRTSTYYNWVKNANAQIAAVDDVLMKATSTAIVATGTYAIREVEKQECTDTVSAHGKLTGVTASNTTQGAIVGCFDYRDTQAFYVMNYSVDGEQTITLTFDNNYDVRIVQDAVNTCGRTMADKTITLKLGAGKGALVVLESTEDQSCYYCKTQNANGDFIFKCQHGGVSENAGAGELYGDIDISDDVNAIDLVRMKKVEAGHEKLRFLGIADLNGDKLINLDDLKLLRRYLVGWISGE